MYVKRNIEVCSYSHSSSGKAVSTTYFECVLVAVGIYHAMRMRHIYICGLNFRKKKVIENLCFDFLYRFCLKCFSF
jgi:hypothetical protein